MSELIDDKCLSNNDFNEINNGKDGLSLDEIENLVEQWTTIITEAMSESIPKRSVRLQPTYRKSEYLRILEWTYTTSGTQQTLQG